MRAIDPIDRTELLKKAIPKNPDAKFHCVSVKDIMAMPSAEPEPSDVARDIATIIENEKDMRVIAQPVRKGKWIEDGYNHYKAVCDQCGEPCATYVNGLPRDRFCKWCGSDMRGEEDDNSNLVNSNL